MDPTLEQILCVLTGIGQDQVREFDGQEQAGCPARAVHPHCS